MEENKVLPETKKAPKKGSVSAAEFASFKSDILNILSDLRAQPKVVADSTGVRIEKPKAVEGATDEETPIPPAWRTMTDEILGKDFVIKLNLPENGGQRFEVYVPREKSNAGKDHWERHHQDKRSLELGNTGKEGVKKWLVAVRKNLQASEIKLPYWENPDSRAGILLR